MRKRIVYTFLFAICILLLFILSPTVNSEDYLSINLFGGTEDDVLYKVIETTDGGFVSVGYTNSNDVDITDGNNGLVDALIVKFDELGNTIWNNTFGGSNEEKFKTVLETSTGDLIAAGYSYSDNHDVIDGNNGESDGLIVKYNQNGEKVWAKTFGGSGMEDFSSIIETSNGSILVVGFTSSSDYDISDSNNGNNDAFIMMLDSDGNKIWDKTLGGNENDYFYTVTETNNGSFVAAGRTYSDDFDIIDGNNGLSDVLITQFDINGNVTWLKTIGGAREENISSILENDVGDLVAVGCTCSNDNDITDGNNGGCGDALILKLDSQGNIIWNKTFGGSMIDALYSLTQTKDNKYIATGITFSHDNDITAINHGLGDALILKFDDNGNILVNKTLGGRNMETLFSIIESDNFNFVAVGYTNSNDFVGDSNLYKGNFDGIIVNLGILDFEPPVITLNGDSEVTVEVNTSYTDLGATAIDNYDEDITIITINQVNINQVGDYVITYNAVDDEGNVALEVTRIVHVVDTTKPVITLNGDSEVTVEVNTSYTDLGATAIDNYDEDITIITSNQVNINQVGDYVITYNAVDDEGNVALEVTRIVHVVDTTKPVITLNGDAEVTVEVNTSYTDLGATAIDNYDEDITIITSNQVNISQVGDYVITYNAVDDEENVALEVTRTVHVVDTTKPVITLNGDSEVTVEVNTSYTDLGATAIDNYDEDIAVITGNQVNISQVGDYVITYNAVDDEGNVALEVIRTVHVVDTTKPVITLNGDSEVTVEVNTSYTDLGATAIDNYDEDIIIITSNQVNINQVGDYVITYNAVDDEGNVALEVIRTVHVADTTKPVLYGVKDIKIKKGTDVNLLAGIYASDNYDDDINSRIEVVGSYDINSTGKYNLKIKVTDLAGNWVEQDFILTVSNNVNVPLIIGLGVGVTSLIGLSYVFIKKKYK